MIGATTFDAIWNALPDARATLRAGAASTARALCASAGAMLTAGEQGLYAAGDAQVNMMLSDDPPGGEYQQGERVALTLTATGHTQQMRVVGRMVTGEILQLTLEGITD